jgi:hypothetical protein
MATVEGRTPIAAIITSFATVPAGRLMLSVALFVAAEDAARNCTPGAAAAAAADRNVGLLDVAALEAPRNAGCACAPVAIQAKASAKASQIPLDDLLPCICFYPL